MKKRGGINEYDYIPRVGGAEEFANMYKALTNHYLKRFCKMYEFPYEDADWIADECGTIAMVGDLFVDFQDIRYCVENKIPYHMFIKWYDLSSELHYIETEIMEKENWTTIRKINLKSYCIGCPLPYTEEEMEKLRCIR